MTIFHTQTEQMSRPTITDSTIQWACQKRWNRERLEDVSGATDDRSVGFMSVPSGDPGRSAPRTGTKTDKPDRSRAPQHLPVNAWATRLGLRGNGGEALRATPTKTRIITTTRPARH